MDFSFPYFGAGEAAYFEWFAMMVRLARKPKPDEQAAIEVAAPAFLRNGGIKVTSTYLDVATGDYIHPELITHYPADDGDQDSFEGRFTFAADSRVRRFNEDIERWLNDVHTIVPIVAAVRSEDWEAGGTALSPWHDWSVSVQLPTVLEAFAKTVVKPNGRGAAARMLGDVLEFARTSGVELSDEHLSWMAPELGLAAAIRASDPERVATALTRVDSGTREYLVQYAVAKLDLEDGVVCDAVLALSDVLMPFKHGWAVVVGCAALSSADPANDQRLATLMDSGPDGESGRSGGFLLASTNRTKALSMRIHGAGCLADPSQAFLLGMYLGDAIDAELTHELHPDLLAQAEHDAESPENPLVLLHLTNALYRRGEFARGIRAWEKAEVHGKAPDAALLNAARLYCAAGRLAEARRCTDLSVKSGDEGAGMMMAALSFAQGDPDAALAQLQRVKASGYRYFEQWRGEVVFATLREDSRYIALFELVATPIAP